MDQGEAGWCAVVKAEIYAEGGGPPSSETNSRCREGFTRLLQNCGLDNTKFQVTACGGGGDARNDFIDAHEEAAGAYYVALLIDSETPLTNIDETWGHLEIRGGQWQRPPNTQDDQVLFMTTCTETWIVADRAALREQFGPNIRTGDLPELDNLEQLSPGNLEKRLKAATQLCPAPYNKGRNSFEVLGKLNPDVLEQYLLSFRRARRILSDKLG